MTHEENQQHGGVCQTLTSITLETFGFRQRAMTDVFFDFPISTNHPVNFLLIANVAKCLQLLGASLLLWEHRCCPASVAARLFLIM